MVFVGITVSKEATGVIACVLVFFIEIFSSEITAVVGIVMIEGMVVGTVVAIVVTVIGAIVVEDIVGYSVVIVGDTIDCVGVIVPV